MVSSITLKEYNQRLDRVCDYIQQNLDESFTLENLSQIAYFSKYHFNRQFSTYVGISVFRYILLMRLKRASYALAFKKDVKIIDIAFDAQFENPESFSRAFKGVFDCSPSQFRKKPQWPLWHEKLNFSLPIEKDKIMDVKIIDFPETPVARLEHRGPHAQLMQTASQFIEWRKQTGLSPIKSSQTYGIAFDDPDTTEPDKFRFDFCGSIEGDVPENPQGVYASSIPAGRCCVIRHLGSHDKIADKIRNLYREWLPESGEELRDFPCFFHYHNLISQVEEHELITDAYLPLKG